MDIDKMEAGRELDAMVAEKVMGWVEVHYDDDWSSFAGQYPGFDLGGRYIVVNGECKEWPYAPVPHYSTRIESAWEVIEKLRARGWYFDIETPVSDNGLYDVSVCTYGVWDADSCTDGWITKNVLVETFPLAICRAALKAVQPC